PLFRSSGSLELPMSLGIVGGASRVHPRAGVAYQLLKVSSAKELSEVIASVGLAQNLGALKALATDGIQKGHMALHSRSVAVAAEATGELVDVISEKMIAANDSRVGFAQSLMEEYRKWV